MVFYDSPRTQLVLIAQCDLVDSVSSVCPETARLMAQSQVLELIARGTAMRDPHPDMFHLILRALRDVREDRDPSIVARVFAMKFLQATGLSPAVDECVHCTRTPRRGTALSSRLGGLLCERCVSQDPSAHTVMPGTLATMQHVLRSHWTNALRVHYGSRIREELDSIMNRYLAFHVDTRLRSRHVPQELAHANASLS
jgi:DNA repair protein RecO (recombination protein O)